MTEQPEFVVADAETLKKRHRKRNRVPKWARLTILGVVVGGLVAGNVYVVKKQFPGDDRQKNAAYDAGLRALDQDKDPEHFARAEVEFRRYLAVDPRHVRVRYLLGVSLQYQGKVPEAREEYARILQANPDFDDARVALAEIAQAEQSYEEAFRQLDLARANAPTPTAVHMLRARLLSETGDDEEAIRAYRETLRLDPNAYESAMDLGFLLIARSLLNGSEADRQAAARAFRDAEEVLRRRLGGGEDKRLRLLLAKSIAAQARVLQQRQLAEAVKEVRRAAELDPEDSEPTIILGEFFSKVGDFEEARRILEDARRKWKTPRVYLAVHDLYAQLKRNDDALKVLTDAVAEWVDDPALRVRLVAYLADIERFDEAEKEAETARQRFPDSADAQAARGDLARKRAEKAAGAGDEENAAKEHATALASYRRALELRPKSIRLKKLVAGQLIHAILAKPAGAEQSEDEKFARRCIEEVLRVNVRDAEALAWRAKLLMADGKLDEVVKALTPTLDLPAPPLDALRLLGVAAGRRAELPLAARAFARVVDMQRDLEREKGDEVEFGPSASDWWNAIHSTLAVGRQEVAIELATVAVRLRPKSVELRRELGTAQLAKGDAPAALKTMRGAKAQFPDDVASRLLLARAYELGGRADAAEDELKAAIVDLPGETTRMAYFEFLARSGRMEQAEQGFLAMTASDPDSPAGWLRLGDFYLALRPPKTEAALQQYVKALELSKGAPAPLLRIAELHLGVASTNVGAYPEADAAVSAYEKAAPGDPWADYLRGKLLLVGGKPAEAAKELAKFVDKVPDSPAGLYYMGRALRDAGDVTAAIDAMERASRLAKDDEGIARDLAVLRYRAGEEAMRAGRDDVARNLFAAAEAGGAGAGARMLLAGAHANLGEMELSEKECRKVLAEDPNNRFGLNLLATLLLRKGTKEAQDEAETLFRKASDVDASDLGARIGVGLVRYQRGDFRGALELFREVYPRTEASPMVALTIAQCMANLSDATGAAEFLDAETKAHPKSDAMRHVKGDFLVHLKQHGDAVREYLAAYDLNPDDVGALLAAAAALLESRQNDAARKLLVERLPACKTPGLVHLALGETLLRSNRVDEGADELRKTLTLIPNHPRALHLLGRVADLGGRKSEAKRLYREAVQHGTPDGDAYGRLAQIAAADGDKHEASELYKAALARDPRNVYYLNNRAVLLGEEEGRLDEAIAAARTAAALAPERPEFADTCGWLCLKAGRVNEAVSFLEPASNLLTKNAVVQFHAGMAFARASRRLEARERLERALRIDPSFEGAEAARAEIEKLR